VTGKRAMDEYPVSGHFAEASVLMGRKTGHSQIIELVLDSALALA
jgi:hypothetical protein